MSAARCHRAPLADLTTLGLGGPARRLIDASTDKQVIEAVAGADAAGERLLVIAGGSNLVIADAGFDGTVVRILVRGVSEDRSGGRVRLLVSAGEPWDEVVARCVGNGLAGIECLSGIPGLTGATPIQNVGAYGQQAFALEPSPLGRPVRYPELARALGVEAGARPPLAAVRAAVLALRRQKGMVIDPRDPDSRSVGSFFLNPFLSAEELVALERRVAQRIGSQIRPPAWPEADGRVKTSAAWLIEHAGFPRGYGDGHVGISGKHTLALVNHGGASTVELLALAYELRNGVLESFGVRLDPEPTLVDVEL